MCGRKSPYVVALTDQERKELNRWTRSTTMPSGLVRRAHAILGSSQIGVKNGWEFTFDGTSGSNEYK